MKTRTSFKLSGKGVVHCLCGELSSFCMDVDEFIIPILEDSITVEFNDKTTIVHPYDNAGTLYMKIWKELTT